MGVGGFVVGSLIGVTGGTGFLGRHLVPYLLDRGFQVRMLVRQPVNQEWLTGCPVDLVDGDVTQPQRVVDFVAGCEYLIHAAGYFRLWGHPALFERVNVDGTATVARAAALAKVRRMVHLSSVVVIGEHPDQLVIREDTPCRPLDAYQWSKYRAEQYLLEMASAQAFPVVILRPSAFYGPYGRYGFNRLFIEDPLRGIRLQVDGGKRLTFPVYVPDVAAAVVLALEKGKSGEIYHIGDQPVTHYRVNRLVSELAGLPLSYWHAPRKIMLSLAFGMAALARLTGQEPFYPLNLRHYVFRDWRVSSEKARKALGFRTTPLEEGLRATIKWYRSFLN